MVLTSLYVGYRFGSRSSQSKDSEDYDDPPEEHEAEQEQEQLEEAENIQDGDLTAVKAGFSEQCKMVRSVHFVLSFLLYQPCQSLPQVLVVRADLRMNPGDISCQ